MLSPIAVGLGFGKWGSKDAEAGPSKSSPKGKGKEKEETPTAIQSFWSKSSTLYGLGAVALGAAAGTAYYRREDFMNGWKWGFDHMTFVRNLWDDAAMKERLETLDRLSEERNIMFWKYVSFLQRLHPLTTVSTRIFHQHRQNRHSAAHSLSYQQRHIQHTTAGGLQVIH
jgi:hypothetical protein